MTKNLRSLAGLLLLALSAPSWADATTYSGGLMRDNTLPLSKVVDQTAYSAPCRNAGTAGALTPCTTLPYQLLPLPTATTPGAVMSLAATSHYFLTSIGLDGSITSARPVCGNLSDAVNSCFIDATNASNISSGVLGSSRGGAGAVSGILKANGSGVVSAATSGTDFAPATSGSVLLLGNGSGGFSNYGGATSCTNQFATGFTAAGALNCSTDVLASAQHANQGTTTTVLHGNASGNPSFGAVVDADLSGLIGLAHGGTNANLSATGGTSQFLRQSSAGAAVTVGRPACTDLSDSSASCATDATNASNIGTGTLNAARLPGYNATTGLFSFNYLDAYAFVDRSDSSVAFAIEPFQNGPEHFRVTNAWATVGPTFWTSYAGEVTGHNVNGNFYAEDLGSLFFGNGAGIQAEIGGNPTGAETTLWPILEGGSTTYAPGIHSLDNVALYVPAGFREESRVNGNLVMAVDETGTVGAAPANYLHVSHDYASTLITLEVKSDSGGTTGGLFLRTLGTSNMTFATTTLGNTFVIAGSAAGTRTDNLRLRTSSTTDPLRLEGGSGLSIAVGGSGTNMDIGTTATDGFIQLPTSNGVPTGVPAHVGASNQFGAPFVFDRSAKSLYANYSGTWYKLTGANQQGLAAIATSGDFADLLNMRTKPSVRAVATTNLTLSGLQTIDNVAASASTDYLLTGQTAGAENGPWTMASGAWTRPAWYASGNVNQSQFGTTIFVRSGDTYSGTTWKVTTSGTITIDTTSTAWIVTPFALANGNITGSLTSAQWAALVSDEVGSGSWVFGTSPQFTTGIGIGVAATTGNSIKALEAAAPSGAASSDLLYPDSTAHRWKMNNNNGGAQNVLGSLDTVDALASSTSAQLATLLSDETGSGVAVFGTSPQFTTGIGIGTPAPAASQIALAQTTCTTVTAGIDYICAGSSVNRLRMSNNGGSVQQIAGSADNLSFFAATTSAQLETVLSDELDPGGSGKAIFSPGGLNVTTGKTLAAQNTLTLIGTDSTSMTFPTTSATMARTDAAQTFTGVQTFGTAIAVGSGGTGLASGTSGGILGYTASGTLASSAALAANAIVIGGGAGATPTTTSTASGIVTFIGTPSSANLAAATTDEVGSGPLQFAQFTTSSKTADYTVTTGDVGKHFDNIGAAGTVNFTVPAAAAGLNYCFAVIASQIVRVKPTTSDVIYYGTTTTTNGTGGGYLDLGAAKGVNACITAVEAGEYLVTSDVHTLGTITTH